MNRLYTNNLDIATDFLEYAQAHRFALLELHKGGKNPVGNDWPDRASTDRAQWQAWRAEGNVGIHAGASRLIIVDLDVTKAGGRDGAWQRWHDWCLAHGLPVYAPQTSSARNGLHVYFKLPNGVDVAALKGHDLAEGINVLVGNRQAVAPGSFFDGTPKGEQSGWYQLFPDAPAPHPAPAALIEHCMPQPRERSASSATKPALDGYNIDEVAKWIERKIPKWQESDEANPWNDQGEWIFFGKALKLHFPNEDGLELFMQVTHDGHEEAASRWDNERDFKIEWYEGARTLRYYLDHDLHWMFRGAPAPGPCEGDYEEAEARRTLRDRRVNLTSLEGKPVPEREWLVPGWIPMEQVTSIYGDGAVGKSLLALMLGTSAITGTPWFGCPVKQGPVEFITAEDSADELHRRAVDIARETRQSLSAFDGMHVSSFADEDAIMAALNGDGQLVKTGFYDEVVEVVAATKPKLLVLDTLADIFGGNEIVRVQVRAFVNMLRKIAIAHKLAVVVLAHPSMSGMTSGKGTSGSTGWSNSVRSRLYFERVYDDQGHENDTDLRVLRSMKINYGAVGNEIRMRWRAGIFVPETNSMDGDPLTAAVKAERVFLELLAKFAGQNRYVSTSPGSSYAPAVFGNDAAKLGINKKALKAAMERLLEKGAIENAPYGAPSKKQFRLYVKP